MFRKASAEDLGRILAFAREKPEENLFLVGDLETYGLDGDDVEAWCEDGEGGALRAVLLRYHRHMILAAAAGTFDAADAVAIAIARKSDFLSCPGSCIGTLRPALPASTVIHAETMARMKRLVKPAFPLAPTRVAVAEDAAAIVAAVTSITEFQPLLTGTPEERTLRTAALIREGITVNFVIDEGGRIAANANTSAMSRDAAMIGGVCALPECRGRGYATSVVHDLCAFLLASGRTPVLFFDNPAAATIYHRLGFEDFSTWHMCRIG